MTRLDLYYSIIVISAIVRYIINISHIIGRILLTGPPGHTYMQVDDSVHATIKRKVRR